MTEKQKTSKDLVKITTQEAIERNLIPCDRPIITNVISGLRLDCVEIPKAAGYYVEGRERRIYDEIHGNLLVVDVPIQFYKERPK